MSSRGLNRSGAGAARYRAGRMAERFAKYYLRLKGYKILAERYRSPVGEVDLIAQRGGLIVFVEVKYRLSIDDAAFSLLPRQKNRIAKAALFWLAKQSLTDDRDCRFDVILLAPFAWPRHIHNAFNTGAY